MEGKLKSRLELANVSLQGDKWNSVSIKFGQLHNYKRDNYYEPNLLIPWSTVIIVPRTFRPQKGGMYSCT